MAEFKAPTPDEFAAITRRTVQRTKRQRLAVTARYDRRGAPPTTVVWSAFLSPPALGGSTILT
jgi:hypothetical protein